MRGGGRVTGRAGRAGGALDDAGGERVALQRRREAALALVALVALERYTTISYNIIHFQISII